MRKGRVGEIPTRNKTVLWCFCRGAPLSRSRHQSPRILYKGTVVMKRDLFNSPQDTLSCSLNTAELAVGNNMRIVCRTLRQTRGLVYRVWEFSHSASIERLLCYSNVRISRGKNGVKMKAGISTWFCNVMWGPKHTNFPLKSTMSFNLQGNLTQLP